MASLQDQYNNYGGNNANMNGLLSGVSLADINATQQNPQQQNQALLNSLGINNSLFSQSPAPQGQYFAGNYGTGQYTQPDPNAVYPFSNQQQGGGIMAHSILDGMGNISDAYDQAQQQGYNPAVHSPYQFNGSSQGQSQGSYQQQDQQQNTSPQSLYGQVQTLTQQQNAANNGAAPNQEVGYFQNQNQQPSQYNPAGVSAPLTPQDYQQQQQAEGNYYGNLLSNTNNAMAWNTLNGSVSGASANPFSSSGSTGSDPTNTYIQALTQAGVPGVSMTTPLSQILSSNPQALLQAAQANEGSSPRGVMFNSGNMKYTPYTASLGGVDSGVKSADGDDFASFPDQQTGDQAQLANWQNYVNKNPNITLADAVHKWTNFQPQATGQAKGQFVQQYGLIGTAPDFNPANQQDMQAYQYLLQLTQTGKAPTLSASASPIAQARFANTVNLAGKLASEVGTGMPSEEDITANKAAYTQNIATLNKIDTSAAALTANFGLNLANMTSNDINGSNQIVNGINDTFKNLAGDPAMAQYLAQHATISNELGNLLGAKNGSGTTVADKIESSGIINPKASLAQQKQIFSILMQEKDNIKNSYVQANQDLYQKIDPLQMLADNPLKQQSIQQYQSQDQQPTNSGTTSGGLTWTIIP